MSIYIVHVLILWIKVWVVLYNQICGFFSWNIICLHISTVPCKHYTTQLQHKGIGRSLISCIKDLMI